MVKTGDMGDVVILNRVVRVDLTGKVVRKGNLNECVSE